MSAKDTNLGCKGSCGGETEKPLWLIRAEKFLDSLKDVRWFGGHGEPKPNWKVFNSREEAAFAALEAAGGVCGDEAWTAIGKAAVKAVRKAGRIEALCAIENVVREVAGDAAWDVAREEDSALAEAAADDAAGDAALAARIEGTSDLEIPEELRRYVRERWEVWKSGYGLVGVVNGVFFCYRKVA